MTDDEAIQLLTVIDAKPLIAVIQSLKRKLSETISTSQELGKQITEKLEVSQARLTQAMQREATKDTEILTLRAENEQLRSLMAEMKNHPDVKAAEAAKLQSEIQQRLEKLAALQPPKPADKTPPKTEEKAPKDSVTPPVQSEPETHGGNGEVD